MNAVITWTAPEVNAQGDRERDLPPFFRGLTYRDGIDTMSIGGGNAYGILGRLDQRDREDVV